MTFEKPVVFAVVGVLCGVLVVLLLGLFGMPRYGTYMLIPLSSSDVAPGRLTPYLTPADLTFSGSASGAATQLANLRRTLPTRYEARSSTRGLVVAVVSMTDAIKPQTGTRKRIDVDFAEAGKAALLIIADKPVVWAGRNVTTEHRAKLAIESQAVFDVADLKPGVLAAFRSRAFGSGDVTGPRDLDSEDNAAKYRFCASLKVWITQFEVPTGDVRVWEITDPTQINLVGDKVTSNGRQRRPFYASDYCR